MSEAAVRTWRVELHSHTCLSEASLVRPEKLLAHCKKIEIDKIAITDHNAIEGALIAQQLAPELVIVGEEIETTGGELLGYFMSELVPAGLEPMEAIARLKAQGAVISVAHPFDTTRSHHWNHDSLAAIAPHIDAIETFNARCLGDGPNNTAAVFAREHDLLQTAGSDAHSLWEIGRAVLLMADFQDAAGFRAALKNATQEVSLSPFYVHLFSRYAVLSKNLKRIFNEA